MQNQELEAVKRERASLLKSLAAVKASQEKTGAKIQEEDIKLLRQELDVKMAKVNELREVGTLQCAQGCMHSSCPVASQGMNFCQR